MIVYGIAHGDQGNNGHILFTGTLEECREYAKRLSKKDYYSINIDEDNGVIIERIL